METKKITPEMYEALKKPLPYDAVKPHPTKTYLSSIKAIYVTERLNDVFGCGSWQIKAEKVSENANLICYESISNQFLAGQSIPQ